MEILTSPQAWQTAGFIFCLRLLDMSLDTMRVLFVMRGRKRFAWIFGFFQALIFVAAISKVLADLDNPLNLVGYAAGFATGNVLGMYIEERLAIGHILMNIVSPGRGTAIAANLRTNGYAVTEIPARGKNGMVSMLNVSVLRKNVEPVRRLVNDIDQEAFITAEDVRPVRRGFWRA